METLKLSSEASARTSIGMRGPGHALPPLPIPTCIILFVSQLKQV